jgi:hypothetical protein
MTIPNEERVNWGVQDLVDKQAWLLHNKTGVIGRARKLYERGEYVGPNARAVDECRVLELDTGDAFLVSEDAFTPLAKREVELVEKLGEMFSAAITVGVRMAGAMRIPLPFAAMLVLGCLRLQERALELEARKAAAASG